MAGRLDDRNTLTDLAARTPQLHGVYEFSTLVTLVSPRVFVRAKRTRSFHKSVCQVSTKKTRQPPSDIAGKY